MPQMRKLSAAESGALEQSRPSERVGRAVAQVAVTPQTARERYQSVLPRWMRNKQGGQQERAKRRRP